MVCKGEEKDKLDYEFRSFLRSNVRNSFRKSVPYVHFVLSQGNSAKEVKRPFVS